MAGREWQDSAPGQWIRPISARGSHELSFAERSYSNHEDPQVGDILMVPLRAARPTGFQTENHLIDEKKRWSLWGKASWKDVATSVEDTVDALWINGHSSGKGRNDRVPEERLNQLSGSLVLIRPNDLSVSVSTYTNETGNTIRKYRALFSYKDFSYNLVLTDPWAQRRLENRGLGKYSIEDAFVCVSLSEPFKGSAYKLVASIITPGRILETR